MKKVIYIFLIYLTLCSTANADWKKIENLPSELDDAYWLDVMFLKSDINYGWVCGFSGLVAYTTDNGVTWVPSTVGENCQLESIHFVNERVGYTSGNTRYDEREPRIFKSTDGGATWRNVTPPEARNLWGCYFINEDTGMTIGGGCDSAGQHFFKTVNGGQSWSHYERNIGESGLTDLILYPHDQSGYAVSSGYLWLTDDLGDTWHVMCRSGGIDWQEEITYMNETFLLPYSGSCFGGGSTLDHIGGTKMTTDFGQSWVEYETGLPMYGTFLINDSCGWACGYNGSIIYTSDAGHSWEDIDCGIDKGDDLDDIWFTDDSTGWVVGRGIYKTHSYDSLYPVIPYDTLRLCYGESVDLYTTEEFKYYTWSNGADSSIATITKSGDYWVRVSTSMCDTAISNLVHVDISDSIDIRILADDLEFCEGDSMRLYLDTYKYKHKWWNGSAEDTIWVYSSTMASVEAENMIGCSGSSELYVEMHPKPDVELNALGRTIFCTGDSVILQATAGYPEYRWAKDDEELLTSTDNRYTAFSSGTYSVSVTSEFGCPGRSDAISVLSVDMSNRISFVDAVDGVYNFDTVGYGQTKCTEIRLHNNSTYDFVLSDAYMAQNMYFSVPQGQFDIIIPPGAVRSLQVCFSPLIPIEQYDTLKIFDICDIQEVYLQGIGGGKQGSGISHCTIPVGISLSDANGPHKSIVPLSINDIEGLYNQYLIDNLYSIEYTIFGLSGLQLFSASTELKRNTNAGDFYIELDTSELQSGIYVMQYRIGPDIYQQMLHIYK